MELQRVGHDFVTEQQQQQGEKSKQPLMALRYFEERILTAFVLRNLGVILHLWKQSCHQLEYNTWSNEPVCSPRCQRNCFLGVVFRSCLGIVLGKIKSCSTKASFMEKNFKSWKGFAQMEKKKVALSPKWENHREEKAEKGKSQPGSSGRCKLRQRESLWAGSRRLF